MSISLTGLHVSYDITITGVCGFLRTQNASSWTCCICTSPKNHYKLFYTGKKSDPMVHTKRSTRVQHTSTERNPEISICSRWLNNQIMRRYLFLCKTLQGTVACRFYQRGQFVLSLKQVYCLWVIVSLSFLHLLPFNVKFSVLFYCFLRLMQIRFWKKKRQLKKKDIKLS